MKTCKYRDCDKVAIVGPFCSTSHKACYYRDQRKGSATAENATDQSATSGVVATNCATSVQPIDSQVVDPVAIQADTGMVPAYVVPATESINWADPDKDYSTIARRTQGAVQLPGDPTYKGVCKCVDSQWSVPRIA